MHEDERLRVRRLAETTKAPPSMARWRVAPSEDLRHQSIWGRLTWRRPLGAAGLVFAGAAILTVGLVAYKASPNPKTSRTGTTPQALALVSPWPTETATRPHVSSPPPSTFAGPTWSSPAPTVQPTNAPPRSTSPTASPIPRPAFPSPPYVTPDGHGGFLISGTGANYWGMAFSKDAGGAVTSYLSPAIPAYTTDYDPPKGSPCVSMVAIKGGTGSSNGTNGNSWTPWVCAVGTGSPSPTPCFAFPDPPYVAPDGHGGLSICGTGDSYWGIAYSKDATSGASAYASPQIPATTTDYTPPSGTPCISIIPQQGGTATGGGTSGTVWSAWVCAK